MDLNYLASAVGIPASVSVCLTIAAIKLWVKDEAKKALKEDMDGISNKIKELENSKVCKESCNIIHNNSNQRFDGIELLLRQIYELLLKK